MITLQYYPTTGFAMSSSPEAGIRGQFISRPHFERLREILVLFWDGTDREIYHSENAVHVKEPQS